MHACYPHLPLEPGANFPADVLDDGAFPTNPYDFSFWGFPCIKHSSLNRTATEADLVGALDLLERALHRLSGNPPSVFVLENTHSLLSGPRWVLLRITSMLGSLPYSWRSAPRISSLSPPPAQALPSVDAALRTPPPLATAGARSSAPASISAPGRPALVSGGWGTYALPLSARCLHPLRVQSTWTAALASAHHATRTRTLYPTALDTASVSPSSIASPSSTSAPSGPT